MSKPLQVYLAESDLKRLEEWSRLRGWTKSHAVRTAIRALIRPRAQDPLLNSSGIIDGLPPDLSKEFNRYLEETFVAEGTSRYRRRKRSSSTGFRR